MTAAPVRADATAVRVAVDLDLPATPGERRVERAVTAIAAALWPYTSDGDLVVGVRGAGLNVDAAVTAADGARPLGSFATGLRRRSEPGRPDALVVDRVDDGDASVTAPIVLTLTPGGAELAVTSPDRDATLLAARVSHAARTVTADPQLPVEELPPSGYERDLFRAWTGAPVRYGRASVDDVVADLAARHPDRVALRHGACTLTYGELLARAEQVATRLRDRGVAPGTIMVLRLARGLDLVVAMLAALRCGAAYCAVDVEWPASRVADVLADTRAPLLVGTAPDGYDGDVPVLSMSDLTAGEPGPRPPAGEAARDPDAGFCVYFTSGSTGRPKGVLSTHRATLRTLLDPPHPRLDETVVTLSAAPLPWDAFTLELWSALLHGGTCVLAVPAHVTPAELRRAVAAGVNSLWLTASLFNVLVDEDLDAFAGVRQVLTGGERLSVPHVARFRRRHPDIILVNGYGPVEATVFATTHQITDADLDTPGGIPIGRPLPGTEVLVLRTTSGGRQVRAGTGEPGEICLAGDGLATGYVGSAAMQNEDRFPVLRLPGEPPVRVYRTGDIGLWRGDGVLLFRGRADRQVKLRGHRVEPGEIETIALRGGMVRQCAVVPVHEGSRVAALAAYVVPADDPFDATAFVGYLAGSLPGYLVPAHVVPVPALPLGATGKLDAGALPPPGPHTRVHVRSHPPATPPVPTDAPDALAGLVAAEAAQLLGLPVVGPDDDLLGLGLDSLGATRLAARLARALDVDAHVATVLEARTPRTLAAALPRRGHPEPTDADHRVLSDGQVGFWLDDQVRPDHALGNIVLLAFRFTGAVEAAALHAALRTVAARHDALRTAIVDDDGLPAPRPLTVDDAVRVEHDEVACPDPSGYATRVAGELATAVNLETGPVTAARTVSLPDGLLLVLALHHAAFDGHSVSLLATEVSGLLRGEALPAPRSYAAYAAGQAALLATPALKERAREWADRLHDVADLRWATGVARGTVPRSCRTIPVHLSPAAFAALTNRARQWGVTPYALALTACTDALAEVTGSPRFCVGTPISDRDPADEHTIGLFVTTLPMLATGTADGAPRDAVRRTAATVVDVLHHRKMPLGQLLRLLRLRGTGRHPLFQVQFAWQSHPQPAWDIPGVTVTEIRIPPLAAQHELTLELWPPAGGAPLTGTVEYDPGAVDPADAEAFARAYVRRLDQLCQG